MNKFNDVINKAAESQDQTKSTGFERDIPPAGMCMARLVGYVEYGPQEFTFNGKSTGIKPAVRITFELLGKKNIKDGKGQLITSRLLKLSLNRKAGFYKLFESMRYGRPEIKHMAQMLGESFMVDVVHNEASDGRIFANINAVSAPRSINEDGDEVLLKVPACTAPLRLFIWESPTIETWNSLYIDGEYQNDDGTVVSKNRIQEAILAGPEYLGSKLEAMLKTTLGEDEINAAFGYPEMDDVPF